MHLPDSAPRAAYARLRERWQGLKLPCPDPERGGGGCVWAGTTLAAAGGKPSAAAAGRPLSPARPPLFPDWARAHAAVPSPAALRACGWSFRGVFAASRDAVRPSQPTPAAAVRPGPLVPPPTTVWGPQYVARTHCPPPQNRRPPVRLPQVRRHPRSFYANLRDQLATAPFPVSGMYMERLWHVGAAGAGRSGAGHR